ncbi:MAG: hypothetical protein R2911_39455 [Caldilineaceae bacterium]
MPRCKSMCRRGPSMRPAGGYFFWLTLPEEADTAELQAKSVAATSAQPGVRFPAMMSWTTVCA